MITRKGVRKYPATWTQVDKSPKIMVNTLAMLAAIATIKGREEALT
jgi:hypothetical protein